MNNNRINPLSTAPTLERQTPKRDFGDVLVANADLATQVGGAFLTSFVPGSGAVSAAVSGVKALGAVASQSAVVRSPGPAPVAGAKGDAWQLLEAQGLQTEHYLSLQNEMQRESREFNTLSNVMKVRHDSAKAAINNIR